MVFHGWNNWWVPNRVAIFIFLNNQCSCVIVNPIQTSQLVASKVVASCFEVGLDKFGVKHINDCSIINLLRCHLIFLLSLPREEQFKELNNLIECHFLLCLLFWFVLLRFVFLQLLGFNSFDERVKHVICCVYTKHIVTC